MRRATAFPVTNSPVSSGTGIRELIQNEWVGKASAIRFGDKAFIDVIGLCASPVFTQTAPTGSRSASIAAVAGLMLGRAWPERACTALPPFGCKQSGLGRDCRCMRLTKTALKTTWIKYHGAATT